MPERASVTGHVRRGVSRASAAGEDALDRLTRSVQAAQDALEDLRGGSEQGNTGRPQGSRYHAQGRASEPTQREQHCQQGPREGPAGALMTAKSAPRRPARPRSSVTAAPSRRKGATASGSRGAAKPATTRRRAPASTARRRTPATKAAVEQSDLTVVPGEREQPPAAVVPGRATGSETEGVARAHQAAGQAAEETGSATNPVIAGEAAPERTAEESAPPEAADDQSTT